MGRVTSCRYDCEPPKDVRWMQVLLGEEVANSKMTLFDVTMQICDAIQARGEQGKPHYPRNIVWYCASV